MRIRELLTVVVVVACGCVSAPPRQLSASETRPALLAALDGDWVMVGDVMGEPVRYRLTVQPVLAQTFTELHMLDMQEPPEYEARVFLGYDGKSDQVIAHWLDVFGAKGSVPHGTGRMTVNAIEFTIPYPDRPFRDTLTFDATAGKWRFTIEASDGSGRWKHFAAYEIERAR